LHYRVVPMLAKAGITPDGALLYFSNDLGSGVQLAEQLLHDLPQVVKSGQPAPAP